MLKNPEALRNQLVMGDVNDFDSNKLFKKESKSPVSILNSRQNDQNISYEIEESSLESDDCDKLHLNGLKRKYGY